MTALTPVTLPTLRATPSVVRALVEGVPEEVRQAAPPAEANAGDWSIATVVAHLIDGHTRQVGRIRLIVEQDDPVLQNVDEWEAMESSGLLGQPTDELLVMFEELRAADVAWYAALDEAALARTGVQLARLIEVAAHAGRGNMRLVDI